MNAIQTLLTENIGIWSAADTEKKSGRGRSSGKAASVYGIMKLRELILQLAISGSLSPSAPCEYTECTLDDIGDWGSGGTPLKTHPEYYGGDIPWLVIGDLNDGLVTSAETKITQIGLANSSAKLVPSGALLIAMYGSIGKLGIAGITCATNQAIAFCNPNPNKVLTSFLFIYLRSIRNKLLSCGQGLAQQNISQRILKSTAIKLPPIQDQHRIVTKVGELMALCDQLETQHSNAAEVHEELVSHLLGTLTQSQNAETLSANWQRIAEHFDTLFTTEASIDALKQTLLQLAVMGKLVLQDLNDEPASELLKRIRAEKSKLIAEGKIKKEKPFPPISDMGIPFDLPHGWEWTFLGQLVMKVSDGPHFSPKYVDREEGVPFISARNVRVDGWELDSAKYISHSDHKEFTKRTKAEVGDILYTKGGTTGVAIVNDLDFEFSVWVHIAVLNIFQGGIFNRYLAMSLNSPHCYSQSQKFTHGSSNKDLGLTRMIHITVPLPPLVEQHRIVAKVDELMALCDQLKTRIAQTNQLQQKLADLMVEQAA